MLHFAKHYIEVHYTRQSIFDCLFLGDLWKTESAREKSSLPHAVRAGILDFTLANVTIVKYRFNNAI